MFMMQKPKSEIEEAQKSYMEKITERVNELKEKIRMSQPPKSLIRERESFLREQKRSALKHRASYA
jgi:hypothetical protein